MNQHRYPRIEKLLAVASFLSADGMGFLAFLLSENHDIETGPLWFIAQMLLLCATLLGIDLKAHPIPPKGKNPPPACPPSRMGDLLPLVGPQPHWWLL